MKANKWVSSLPPYNATHEVHLLAFNGLYANKLLKINTREVAVSDESGVGDGRGSGQSGGPRATPTLLRCRQGATIPGRHL